MSAIYVSDTGHVTITAARNGASVSLTGAIVTIIVKHKETKVWTTLAEVTASSNRAAGIVVADAGPLGVGTYDLVMRAVAGGITATYPSADKQPETLFVVADLDAVA